MEKTLGGERLGSGKKIKVDLHNWGRSTFDQSRIWRSTMAVGVLTPCFTEIGLPGTTFDININTLGHTIPTIAPLFGSFKLQVDMFACPIRLYQGILHNNAVNIGLDMSKVLLPTIRLGSNTDTKLRKTATSSLNNYLGIKGYGTHKKTFSALSHLAYYDIFKNYYSNKQEENAKIIAYNGSSESFMANAGNIKVLYISGNQRIESVVSISSPTGGVILFPSGIQLTNPTTKFFIPTTNQNIKKIDRVEVNLKSQLTDSEYTKTLETREYYEKENKLALFDPTENQWAGYIEFNKENATLEVSIDLYTYTQNLNVAMVYINANDFEQKIVDFPLSNIDDARRAILKKTELNQKITINDDINYLPYSVNLESNINRDYGLPELNGLMLKTYQNDIFNTWLSTEFIDMINDITSITPDSEGNISIDAMILMKKVYNILNRIAISGGTYEDWQESVYGDKAIRRAESPIYIGGTSSEITFEEVVSTTSGQNANGGFQPLATLAGKGIMKDRKGGNIVYKCEEPCIIMAIASITPRVDYFQGNKWFMTEIDSMDDWHKPGLDGIGFQNLVANQVVWSDATDKALAKQPVWLNYQTAVNEVFGQFAIPTGEANSLMHMVLTREYETNAQGEIQDFTSYIDPTKFNYAFADNSLTAQNFWMQIGFNVKSRRKMASQEIPNL